jgi:glutathione S-transferase
MRARMALKIAAIEVEVREISLREKPKHMLALSPKGTVPVLVLEDGQVIEQSLDIMYWALQSSSASSWLYPEPDQATELIVQNDIDFKRALDGYKYPERHPEYTHIAYRQQGELFLDNLNTRLQKHRYLITDHPTLADIAIFPFVRQFAAVDSHWFAQSCYVALRVWLNGWIESDLFQGVMQKYPTYNDSN